MIIIRTSLTNNLKRQVNELRTNLKEKSILYEQIKRDKKTTKINEINMELEIMTSECTRLRLKLEEAYEVNRQFKQYEN